MKFASVLRHSAQDLPDTAELFALYKQLKKSLKRVPHLEAPPSPSADSEDDSGVSAAAEKGHAKTASGRGVPAEGSAAAATQEAQEAAEADAAALLREAAAAQHAAGAASQLAEAEAEFLRAITTDVERLNERYMEREEMNVIQLGELELQAASARTPDEVDAAYAAWVDFHGELLQVLNWSILAYTGLVKILKKHRKRTGLLLTAPHLQGLLSQPFCSVEVTSDMVRRAETRVSELARRAAAAPGSAAAAAAAAAAAGPPPLAGGDAGRQEEDAEAVGRKRTADAAGLAPPPAESVALAAPAAPAGPGSSAEGAPLADEAMGMRRARAALSVWQQLRVTASSPSTVLGEWQRPRAEQAASAMTDSSGV